MSFEVGADAYGQFMGRYSEPLGPRFAALAQLSPGRQVLDVGCGPGALTAVLVEAVGAEHVVAVDPSESFVAAVRGRLPGVDVREAAAERLPFADGSFDAAMAQLVVHFMPDPVAGIREMARVTRRGGVVAACVWDHAGGRGPLSTFWRAARDLDPAVQDESDLPGTRDGHLVELFEEAGLDDVTRTVLTGARVVRRCRCVVATLHARSRARRRLPRHARRRAPRGAPVPLRRTSSGRTVRHRRHRLGGIGAQMTGESRVLLASRGRSGSSIRSSADSRSALLPVASSRATPPWIAAMRAPA